MMRDVPLDMQPYAMILGTHRQPNKGVDKLLHTDNADHIVVISNNHVSWVINTTYINQIFVFLSGCNNFFSFSKLNCPTKVKSNLQHQ